MKKAFIMVLLLSCVAAWSLDAQERTSAHLRPFLTLIDACSGGFLRFEPSSGCEDADYAAVWRRLCEQYGSPSLNRKDLVTWDDGRIIVSLQRGDVLNARSIKVLVMVPEEDRAVFSSASANARAARKRKDLIRNVDYAPPRHAAAGTDKEYHSR